MLDIVIYIFRAVALVLVAVMWIYTIKNYSLLPDKIPTHFDLEQKPDSYGNKKFVFLMPVLAIIVIAVFVFAGENSNGNYPVKITQENSDMQFTIMRILMSWLSLIISLTLLNIQDFMIRLSIDAEAKPKVHLFLPVVFVFLGVITAIICAYIYK